MSGRCEVKRAALAAAVLVVLSVPSAAMATTWVVGRDGATVQATLDRAQDGDVVEVPAGVWAGPARLERRVELRGTGGVLDGGGQGTVLKIAGAGAVVRGLTIRGSGGDLGAPDCCAYMEPTATGAVFRDNTLTDCAFGLWVHEVDGAQIVGNRVRGRAEVRDSDRGNGIHLFDASHLVVSDNEVIGARDGIYVSATEDSLIENNRLEGLRYGVHYMFSYRNTLRGNVSKGNLTGFALMQSRNMVIEGNVAEGNTRDGILFRDAQTCQIRGNKLIGNGQGLFFFSSTENQIEDNEVVGNDIGAKIWAGSVRNHVVGNRFVGNRQQVFYVGATDLVLGEGEPGNTWSDYMGWDQDGDGVGDRPYRMDSFSSHLLYQYPSSVFLLQSPALELLAHLEEQLPLLRVPTIVDASPVLGKVQR